MTASKRTKKESLEEVQMSRPRLQELRRGKDKRKPPAEVLKESEERTRIFASYQQAISELHGFYVREATFDQMLQKTVDLFVKSFGYYMAWYGELKSDEKVIIPKVWAGKYEKYLDGLRLELDDSKDAKCAMSLAIVNEEPFGYADLEQDKDFEKWRPLALKYGYRSNQAIPLVIAGKSVGAFLIYSTRLRAFSRDVIRYLAGIANELATIIENISERKKAEEAYRALVDQSLQGLVIFQGGCVVFANQAMAEITGYTVDEMLAMSSQQVRAFVHPQDRALVWRRHQDRLRGKRVPERYELRGIRKDGTICWLEIHASRIEYRGKPAVQAAYVDITERKQMEESLRRRTEELTSINEMAIELAIASSAADIYRLVCEKLKSMTGALLTGITSYDPQRQELKVEHISADSKFIMKASELLGQKVEGLRIPLESHHIEMMLSEKAGKLEGLHELMFGAIPRNIANTHTEILKIGDVYGLALHYGGKIIGTMPILMPQRKPSLSIEMLKAFANMVTASLRRMKAEQERVAAVQERAAVIDAMSDALVVLNLDGKIISCNPAHLKMFGLNSVNEVSGRHFSEFRQMFCDPEENIPKLLELFRALIQQGFCEPVEVRIRRTDGEELTVSASGNLQRDAMGNPQNVVAILRDITPQKHLQEVEREAAVTRTAVETIEGMLEGVTIMDLDGTIRQVNSEFESGSGYKREEVIGKKAIELGIISEQENERIKKEIIPTLMNEGLVRNIETVAMSRDGTSFSALMSWRLMKDAQGNPKSIIATATDITEQKRAEEKLLDYQERLRSMASQLSLIEERERRRIATELHDRVGQDLALSMLRLDNLRKSASSGILAGQLGEIAGLLEKVVQDTRFLVFDLCSPLLYTFGLERTMEEWLTQQVQQRHSIKCEFEDDGQSKPLEENVCVILFQATREVLINVIKHAQASLVNVSIRRKGMEIEIVVQDDGVGFDLSEIEPGGYMGDGFGLFSIRERLTYLGGGLKVESELGHGTRVTLVAPLKAENESAGEDQYER